MQEGIDARLAGHGKSIIFKRVTRQVCQEFVLFPLVNRPTSESELTMSPKNVKQGSIMFILFIAKINRTFLRGNQSAEPFLNAIRKRVCNAPINRTEQLTLLIVDEGPFFFADGVNDTTHGVRDHS